MHQIIMVACDLHDKTMLLKVARGCEAAETFSITNTAAGRKKLFEQLARRSREACGAAVIFAYEASGQGFGLYDEVTEAGFTCHVLAPTKIARSPQHRRGKTDDRDAEQILQLLRGHALAGNPLPSVWVPDQQTRDDRELVRTRQDLAEKIALLKSQIQSLLKRNHLRRPDRVGKGWTRFFLAWLRGLTTDRAYSVGMRTMLASLLRQLDFCEQELEHLDLHGISQLAESERYLTQIQQLMRLSGVGVLTALTFLTELGDLRRFSNRRQLSAYLGLAPSSYESGAQSDRKGHITRQGPSRVRRVLCQAAWARVRTEGPDQRAYERIKLKNPKRTKIAVVAIMRRLAVRMWHQACRAQERAPACQAVSAA
jgi:transposase